MPDYQNHLGHSLNSLAGFLALRPTQGARAAKGGRRASEDGPGEKPGQPAVPRRFERSLLYAGGGAGRTRRNVEALAGLRDAISEGFKNVQGLKTDPDFAPLRRRAPVAFQNVLNRIGPP